MHLYFRTLSKQLCGWGLDTYIHRRLRLWQNELEVTITIYSSADICKLDIDFYVGLFFLLTLTSALTLVLNRFSVVYASKKRLSTTLNLHVLEAIDTSKVIPSPTRTAATSIVSYRPYGDVSNILPTSSKRIPYVYLAGICTKGCVRRCWACKDDWDLHS